VTRNGNNQNAESEIWTNRSSHSRQNPSVARRGNRFHLPWCSRLDVWIGYRSHLTIFAVYTQATGNLLSPIANTTPTVTQITLNYGHNICPIIAPNKVTNFVLSLCSCLSLGSVDVIHWATLSVQLIPYSVEVHLQSCSIYAVMYIRNFSLLRDRSLSSVARDESHKSGDESRMARDYYRPDKSIRRCVCTHSLLYFYIYGPVALFDNIQSRFSSITISTGYEPGAHNNLYYKHSIYIFRLRASKPLTHSQPSLLISLNTITIHYSTLSPSKPPPL
jgi:hypothetical protein